MKNFLLLLAIIATFSLPAQEKGASPITTPLEGGRGVTRAVVVGISDYLEPEIPDLLYAHRDAEAFANWLRSPAGGSVPNENIMLYTNEQATTAQIIVAIEWLIEESLSGDRAVIYLSGHGDVEQVTKYAHGYFLGYNSPHRVYGAGAFSLRDLKDMVSTMSDKGVQVLVVSDACRSGKLAGSEIGGPQATSTQLAQQFNNEILILSCQPQEFSLEGVQWGDGRGLFSYHLENALYGIADVNRDLSLDLREVRNYLEETVPAEAAPNQQMPVVNGPVNSRIAIVDPATLEQWQARLKDSPVLFKDVVDKTMDAFGDSTLYQQFLAAIEAGYLMAPAGESANDYYTLLVSNPDWERFHGHVKRKFVVALADEAQLVINQLLRTDPQIVDDAFSPVGKYDHLPAYLARAAEILGDKHYMHRYLKAKEYYFRSKTYRKERFPEVPPDSLLGLQLASLDTALGFDTMAAYVYFEKGYLQFWGMAAFPELYLEYLEKSLALSPEWVLPIYFTGRSLCLDFAKCEESEKYMLKAIMLDSSFFPAYRDMGYLKSSLNKPEESKAWFEAYDSKIREYISKQGDRIPVTYYAYWGDCLRGLRRFEESVRVLTKGAEMSNYQHPSVLRLLTYAYDGLGKYREVKKAATKAIELNPLNPEVYHWVGAIEYYYENKPLNEATRHFYHCLRLMPNDFRCLSYLSWIYLQTNQLDSAGQVLHRWLNFYPGQPEILLGLAKWYKQKGMEDAASGKFKQLLVIEQPIASSSIPLYYFQIISNYQLGNHDAVSEIIERSSIEAGGNPDFYFVVACVHAFNGEDKTALEYLETALQKGWKPHVWIWYSLNHPDLYHIRHTPAFQSLVKKYLPDYYKE